MTSFVTGGTGFIGSHLVERLAFQKEEVVTLVHDYKKSEWLRHAIDNAIGVRGDVRDIKMLKRVLAQYNVSTIYHLAAQSIVKQAWRDPVNTFEINVMGTINILEVSRQLDIEQILIQSTDKVYGNQEDAEPGCLLLPTEPYGSSKICADVIAQTFINTYGMNVLIARPCNVYGYDLNSRIIPNTIRTCLDGKNPIIYKNDDSKRQYIYIDDLLECFDKLISTKSVGPQNIASETIRTQVEVVQTILKHFPKLHPRYLEKPRIKQISSQSMRCNVPTFDVDFHTFEKGIELTIDAFRKWGY